MDNVLKVSRIYLCKIFLYTSHLISEHVSDAHPLVQVHQRSYAPVNQFDEKLRFGDFLYRSLYSLPTCIWLYQTAGYTSSQQHES